jgi:hypothetical protein
LNSRKFSGFSLVNLWIATIHRAVSLIGCGTSD